MSISILLVDDHNLFRSGVRQLLQRETDLQIVAEAADGLEGLKRAKALRPDVILLDLNMPGLSGLETLHLLTQDVPESRVVVLTVSEEGEELGQALQGGAVGYLTKNIEAETLVAAIRKAKRGEPVIAESMTVKLVEQFRSQAAGHAASADERAGSAAGPAIGGSPFGHGPVPAAPGGMSPDGLGGRSPAGPGSMSPAGRGASPFQGWTGEDAILAPAPGFSSAFPSGDIPSGLSGGMGQGGALGGESGGVHGGVPGVPGVSGELAGSVPGAMPGGVAGGVSGGISGGMPAHVTGAPAGFAPAGAPAGGQGHGPAAASLPRLTAREREIMQYLARGESNKEIARRLDVAESTVKIHVQNIMKKTGLTSRVQIAVYAVENGLSGGG